MYEAVLNSSELLFKRKIDLLNIEIKWKIVHSNIKPRKDGSIGDVTIISEKLKNVTDYDLLIVINDDIFGRLDDKYQNVIADKMIAKVNYDFKKDMLKAASPDFKEFSGVLEKHGYNLVTESLSEIRRLQKQIEEDTQSSDGKEL